MMHHKPTSFNTKTFPPDLTRDVRARALGALREMRKEGNSLSFSKTAKRWRLDTRTLHKYAKSGLRKAKSGHVKARPNDRIRYTFQKPTTKPGVYQPVVTQSRKERQQFVKWLAAIEAAKTGDFSKIDALPKNIFVDGTRLPTGHYEVQKICEALETEGAKFEGPYRIGTVAA